MSHKCVEEVTEVEVKEDDLEEEEEENEKEHWWFGHLWHRKMGHFIPEKDIAERNCFGQQAKSFDLSHVCSSFFLCHFEDLT